MTDFFYAIGWTVLTLVIWFKTSAFVEYISLLPGDIFKVKQYQIIAKDDPELTYFDFLLSYYNCFLVRLISCEKCFSVWAAFIYSLIFANFEVFPLVTILSLIFYKFLIKFMND